MKRTLSRRSLVATATAFGSVALYEPVKRRVLLEAKVGKLG